MKEPWEWTEEDDILNLIRHKVREGTTLEYKACGALQKTPEKKDEVSRDVSAFANSAGGAIIYGVTEDKTTHEPKGIDAGYDPADISAEWLEQVINSNIERRISGIVINTVPLTITRPGKVLYVVYVPESNLAPHMAADDRFYRRFNTQRLAMKEYEVRNLMRREQYPSREVAKAWRSWVLNPLLSDLRREREYLERRKWAWDIYRGGLQGLMNLDRWAEDSGDKEEFLRLHPHIRAAMEEHDRRAAYAHARCNALFEQVWKSTFLRDLYEQTTSAESLEPLRADLYIRPDGQVSPEDILSRLFADTRVDERLKVLAQYVVVEAGRMAQGSYTTAPFWNMYGDAFRALTQYPPLRAYKLQADDAREQLLLSVIGLITELKTSRAELCRRHGIPIEPPPEPEPYLQDTHRFRGL